MTFNRWLLENSPKDMPFYPGAGYTEWFGLRRHRSTIEAGASPAHLGVDRAGGDALEMPFDGTLEWDLYQGSPLGSLLRLTPDSYNLQIQVFHTEAQSHVTEIAARYNKGDKLPVKPGSLGLSTGIHTHTEVMFPYTQTIRSRIVDTRLTEGEPYVVDGEPTDVVQEHCVKYDLHYPTVRDMLKAQIDKWGITELAPHYAIRESVWRAPWDGPVLFADSYKLLLI